MPEASRRVREICETQGFLKESGVPERFRQLSEQFRQTPEVFRQTAGERRQLTEQVRFVPAECGELPEKVRGTVKKSRRWLRGGAEVKISFKIFIGDSRENKFNPPGQSSVCFRWGERRREPSGAKPLARLVRSFAPPNKNRPEG
jgi:hypothetical protein